MINIFIVLGLILFFFILGFFLGYFFIRTRCKYGGMLLTDNEENITYAKLEDKSVITEGSYVTFKIKKDKS